MLRKISKLRRVKIVSRVNNYIYDIVSSPELTNLNLGEQNCSA